MIAKLISHGATRGEARRKLISGLEQTAAFGVTTNQAFLAACLAHPEFASGEATTAFIGRHRDELLAPRKDPASEAALAALLLYVTDAHAPPWRSGRSLAATFPVPVRVELDHGVHESGLSPRARWRLSRQPRWRRTPVRDRRAGQRQHPLPQQAAWRSPPIFLRDGDRLYLLHRGVTTAIRDLTLAAPAAAAATGSDGKVRAAMNGRVVAVLVKPGDRVAAGQPVMTLEAMKMEHVHAAPISRA